MKKIIKILVIALSAITVSCYSDYDYYDDDNTNLDGNIANTTNFRFSTPVVLNLLDNTSINDTIIFKVGDTIKLSLDLNSIHEEEVGEKYDLYKSSNNADYFTYKIYNYSENVNFERYIIDLNMLDNNPEIAELSREEILSNPSYSDFILYNNEVKAHYDAESQTYKSKIGLIITDTYINNIDNNEEQVYQFDIEYNEYISNYRNDYYYYDDYYDQIRLNIPIISELDNLVMIVE